MSERSTGATDAQIERAIDTYCTFNDFRTGQRNCYEIDAKEWAAAYVTTEERIVSVSDLRLLIGGLSTEELESGEFPKLSAAANRVWKLIRDGEEAAIGDAP